MREFEDKYILRALFFWVLLWVIVGLFASCNKEHEHYIDPELNRFYQEFIQDGKDRGHDFSHVSMLIIFDDIDTWGKGSCKRNRVRINETFWKNNNDRPHVQKALMYHELGHALLCRGHEERTKRPQNSIMVEGGYFIEFKENEKYYIDELFNQ